LLPFCRHRLFVYCHTLFIYRHRLFVYFVGKNQQAIILISTSQQNNPIFLATIFPQKEKTDQQKFAATIPKQIRIILFR
jgi:hypothetical protein